MCANLALISGIENSCHHGANYQTANMIKEADPRVGFFGFGGDDKRERSVSHRGGAWVQIPSTGCGDGTKAE